MLGAPSALHLNQRAFRCPYSTPAYPTLIDCPPADHALVVVLLVAGGRVPRDVIGLVTSRADVSRLLELDDVIDLVIPRGSSELVKSIKVRKGTDSL